MIERFLNLPCVVETGLGQVVGVLIDFGLSRRGGITWLLIGGLPYAEVPWVLVRNWRAIKSSRSHT